MSQLVFHYHNDLPIISDLKADYLKKQVKKLKNIYQPEQKSKEWYEMRQTMLSASDWGTILGENHHQKPNQVLLKKCGEDKFFMNEAMEWGNKYEDVAVLVYEYRNKLKVLEFGCLRHPYIYYLGASPDGITEDGIMLEIKCPTSRKIDGIPPSHYWCQVQGQLEVCDLDRCDFLECLFKEYENEKEFNEDNYNNDYNLNRFGNEKGIIAEFYKKSDKLFYYKYGPIVREQLDLWKINIINEETQDNNNILFSKFYYCYLEEVSCVPIYRNSEWFYKIKPILEEFWNKVLKYRDLGLEILKRDIETEKEDLLKIKLEKKEANKKQKKINEFIDLNIKDENKINNNISMFSDHNNNKNNISMFSDHNNNKNNISMFSEHNENNISMFSDHNENNKIKYTKKYIENNYNNICMFSEFKLNNKKSLFSEHNN
jgi:putative phage-type endonuclease